MENDTNRMKHDTNRMTVEQFKSIRQLSGLSQKGLALEVRISRSAVAKIESGERNLTQETENRVREAYGNEFVEDVGRLLDKYGIVV